MPENYAGNAVFHAISPYTSEDLRGDKEDVQSGVSASTLSRVARCIRSSILERDSEFMRDAIAFLSNQKTGLSSVNDNVNFFCGPDVAFTCWAKMGLYDAEFGGTRPWYASIPACNVWTDSCSSQKLSEALMDWTCSCAWKLPR